MASGPVLEALRIESFKHTNSSLEKSKMINLLSTENDLEFQIFFYLLSTGIAVMKQTDTILVFAVVFPGA